MAVRHNVVFSPMRLMMNVEMLGTNTMVMPVVMPGMESGEGIH